MTVPYKSNLKQMDTSLTESPVGGEGATSSPDTDSQVTTQPDQSETGVSDAQTEQSGEALLAGKYKSPQELEKAYLEAQKKISEYGQKAKVADTLYEKYGVTPEQLQANIAQQERQEQERLYGNNPLLPIVNEVQQLKSQLALQNEEKELDKFLGENPDYRPYRDKILKLGLSSEQDKTYQEIATEWFGEARAQGQQDAYKKIDTKEKTRATGASQAPPKRSLTPDEMNNLSSDELEKVLPWADTSARPY